jgi:hypothetical protein
MRRDPMLKGLSMPQRWQLAEPARPPGENPLPDRDPVQPPPSDPREDRPLRDPLPPDGDRPRS